MVKRWWVTAGTLPEHFFGGLEHLRNTSKRSGISPSFHQLAKFLAVHHLFTIFSPTHHLFTNLQAKEPIRQIFGSSPSFHNLFTNPTSIHHHLPNSPSFANLQTKAPIRQLFTDLPTFRQFTIFPQSFYQLTICPPFARQLAKCSQVRQHFANLSNVQQFAIFSQTFMFVCQFTIVSRVSPACNKSHSCQHFPNLPNTYQLNLFTILLPPFTNLQTCCQFRICSTSFEQFADFSTSHHCSQNLFTHCTNR